ncbi:MAG: hypothetical protein KF868_10940 [Acidobacteria bacterium]|nr:hypothetical protein [Acidobacteriota bacterium]MCW5969044.1 hypothetical protein [Blastocatellales bacterium]
MRTAKRYTTQTIKKRVDDDKGRHHTRRALPEPTICEVCGDIYSKRRWTRMNAERRAMRIDQFMITSKVVCPACERQRSGVHSGELHLEGRFFDLHQKEIRRLLENEAQRAAIDNPMARIMKWEVNPPGQLVVTTTTEHLAQRLGHALSKAFHGRTRYGFSHRNKFARVWWSRN